MKCLPLLVLIILAILPAVYAIEINEIMYNPVGDDSGNEWVEIYLPEKINLSNWTIGDLASNDTLIPVKITDSAYAIVVENRSMFSDSNASVYYASSTIGNGLGNSGDTIFLYDLNKTIVDSVVYNSTFANGNNKTLEKFNGSWSESIAEGGTPGFENSASFSIQNFTNSTINETINNTNSTNTTQINDTNPENQTEENNSACISEISINTTKEIWTDEAIKFRHIVNSSYENYSIVYWVEDLFGNVAKSQYETKTLAEKSFTPHPSERDTVYVVKSILKGCNESYAEKTVIYITNESFNGSANENSDSESNDSGNEDSLPDEKPKFSYELLSYLEEIPQNSDASAVVRINSDENSHDIYIQVYIYRYSKKYSDIGEAEFTIGSAESNDEELNFFTNASPGQYKMKIKITKDELKTPYEITKNVTVIAGITADIQESGGEQNSTGAALKNETNAPENKTEIPKNITKQINITNDPIVYQSKQAKSEYLVPIIIISILAVVSGVLIWKR